MKIVDRETFMALPNGVMFSEYEPHCIEVPEIRGTVIPMNEHHNGDFEVTALVDIMTDHVQEDGTYSMDFDFTTRSGCDDRKQLYAVWEKKDIQGLINQLEKAMEHAPGELPSEPKDVPLSFFVADYNPFEEFPEFREIWPDRDNAPEGDFKNWLEKPGTEVKFLICVENIVVGLTGLWEMEPGKVALAWHGIVPSQRGKGYSQSALRRLITMCPQLYPEAEMLVESIPADREKELAPYFLRNGFIRTGNVVEHPEMYDGVVWMEYVYRF